MKLVFLVAIAAIIFAANPCIAAQMPSVGMAPPELGLQNLQNKTINLSDFHGKPVILAFVASWSDSCKKELAALDELYGKYKNKGLEVVVVSFDKKLSALKEFIANNKYEFDILVDKKLKSLDKYAILIIPTTFAIGKDGTISKIFVDYDDNVSKSIRGFVESQIK